MTGSTISRTDVAGTSLNAPDSQALTDKLDQTYKSLAKNKLDKALDAMSDFVGKVR